MIITIQGYNNKKNKATYAAAALSGMTAVTKKSKTLVIQLIDKNINAVETMLNGKNMLANQYAGKEISFIEEGIDTLLKLADTNRVVAEDFEEYSTSILSKGRSSLLDITAISKNAKLTDTLIHKKDAVKTLLQNANRYYDVVYVLISSENEDVKKYINEMADSSIYCVTQGHHLKGKVYGNNILYLITEYEEESSFGLKTEKKHFCTNKTDRMLPIYHNVRSNDAATKGTLISFININKNTDTDDANHNWSESVKSVINTLIDKKDMLDDDANWNKLALIEAGVLKEYKGIEQAEISEKAVKTHKVPVEETSLMVVGSKPEKSKGLFGFLFKKNRQEKNLDEIIAAKEKKHMEMKKVEDIDNNKDCYEEDFNIVEDEDDDEFFEDFEEYETPEPPVKRTAEKSPVKKTVEIEVGEDEEVVIVPKKKTASKKAAPKAATKTTTKAATTKKAPAKKSVAEVEEVAEEKKPVAKKAPVKTSTNATAKSSTEKTTTAATKSTTAKAPATKKTTTTKTVAKKPAVKKVEAEDVATETKPVAKKITSKTSNTKTATTKTTKTTAKAGTTAKRTTKAVDEND